MGARYPQPFTTLGLHLGTLERLAGSAGHKAVAAIRQVAEMIEPIAPAGFRSQFPLPSAP